MYKVDGFVFDVAAENVEIVAVAELIHCWSALTAREADYIEKRDVCYE
jgi:hypothetical protein